MKKIKITDKEIKSFIKEKYSDAIDYDGVRIEREERKFGIKIDVKIISFGKKIAHFQGYETDKFFEQYEIHTNWQLGV